MSTLSRRLQLVHSSPRPEERWAWFCGRCGAPGALNGPPSPLGRICPSCNFGLLLETRHDMIPRAHEAFMVVDPSLRIQGLSWSAEKLLTLEEELAINRPASELLIGTDAEAASPSDLAAAIAQVVSGGDGPPAVFVRPWNTFGVRLQTRISACGPPRAALVVLQGPPSLLQPLGGELGRTTG